MKKIFVLFIVFFLTLSCSYAQKGKQAIGFGLSYGTEIESIGLGIKYQYNITNPIRIEPSLNYFFENDNVSMLDVNVNFHYLFAVSGSVKLYPLFGLTLSNWMFDGYDLDLDWDGDHLHFDDGGNHNECRFGINLGAGAEFALPRNWAMNFEFRYQLVSDFDQGIINIGAAYRF
ncbi:outer membrane protein [Bacteroides thetaiotaomicron]|jgi:outer membrane protein X|uniref:outer membrane protein n=1 Tax=Bacteroides thetaiotaomicron TaxID=818 RepID=UPI0018A1711A|nr:porin family protein [Bacteroides thetaiotaomicron]MDC2233421.1 porin family protein [Bacteroides thetaiotaomicron]